MHMHTCNDFDPLLHVYILANVFYMYKTLTFHCIASQLEVPAPGVTSVLYSEGAFASSYGPVCCVGGRDVKILA